MAVVHDGGGSGDDFPRVKPNFQEGTIIETDGHVSGGPHAQSGLSQTLRVAANFNPIGGLVNAGAAIFGGGAADDVSEYLSPTDPDALIKQGKTWGHVSTAAFDYRDQVMAVMNKLANWQGDDADKARQVLKGLYMTYHTVGNTSSTMSSTVGDMGQKLKWAKDNYGDGGGIGDTAENFVTGGGADDEAADAYQSLMKDFNTNMGYMPTAVPSEAKESADSPSQYTPPKPPSSPGVNAPPGVGGAGGAPHVGNVAPPHIPEPKHPIVEPPPKVDPPPRVDPPPHIDNPDPYQGGGGSTFDPSSIGSPGSGSYTGGGSGLGGSGVDTSGSLAGYDPSAAGGAGSLGGAPGGGSGAGLPGGGVPGGGAGLGAGGAGAGAGGGGGIVGGGAGGRGMMPMHGNQNNDEEERERTTWLNEDEDVWGAEENLPGVIH